MSARAIIGRLAAGLAVVALQSCTAVLGMERATLEVSTDAAAGGSGNMQVNTQPTNNPCTEPPAAECVQCLQGCGPAYSACINDPTCRISLDEYALCLGDACDSSTPEVCAGKHLSPTLRGCLANCDTACAATALAKPCDLYCGCMPQCDTADFQQAHPEAPILKGQDCITECEKNSATPGLVECLRSHCEYGKGRFVHCEHATGINPVCADAPPPKGPGICLGLKEAGWFCETNSQCCSKHCNSGACG